MTGDRIIVSTLTTSADWSILTREMTFMDYVNGAMGTLFTILILVLWLISVINLFGVLGKSWRGES